MLFICYICTYTNISCMLEYKVKYSLKKIPHKKGVILDVFDSL